LEVCVVVNILGFRGLHIDDHDTKSFFLHFFIVI
jgi:hypothetical protein